MTVAGYRLAPPQIRLVPVSKKKKPPLIVMLAHHAMQRVCVSHIFVDGIIENYAQHSW
jgi:hypothetical protein